MVSAVPPRVDSLINLIAHTYAVTLPVFEEYNYIPEKRKFSGILCFRQQRNRVRRRRVRRRRVTISLVAKWAILTRRGFVVFTNFYD